MADGSNSNPFVEDDGDFIENELEEKASEKSPSSDCTDISWDNIAVKLLRDNFVLTALELHTELVESGRELPRLRDYFSNPGNFERTKVETSSPTLQRTSSVHTLDSLDFARYSDDGERQVDERMAVLEFELRKAHETIKGLRATLTKETELASPEQGREGLIPGGKEEIIKLLEKKALNFLVNEYLLLSNYKLTSVTFSEENGDQDFEDWDDVGLNIPKPPSLLYLFRDYGTHAFPSIETYDVGCYVNLENEHLIDLQTKWKCKKDNLESKIFQLENEIIEINKQKDELILQLNEWRQNASSPENTSIPNHSRQLSCANSHPDPANIENAVNTVLDGMSDQGYYEQQHLNPNEDERTIPPSFEKALLETTLNLIKDHRIVSEVSKISDSNSETIILMLARCLPHIVPHVLLARREELIPLILCTTVLHPDVKERDKLLNILFNLIKKPNDDQRQMILRGCVAFAKHVGPARLENELLPQCWEQISHKYSERRLLVAEACGALASYLPNEIRSSLVLSMLQQMLTEDKDEAVREAVVKSLGILFSFICDTDKYGQGFELLKISLNDDSEKVCCAARQVFLPSFALWAVHLHKLEYELLHSFLRELEDLVKSALAVQKSNSSITLPIHEGKFASLVSTLEELVPFLFISVIRTGPYIEKISHNNEEVPEIDVFRFPKPSSDLTDLRVIFGNVNQLSAYIEQYEEHISQEWFEPWEQFNWVVKNLIPRLQEVVSGVGLTIPVLISILSKYFYRICRTFGRTFVDKMVKPKFQDLLVIPEGVDNLVTIGQTALTTCIVPVYAAGVLCAFNSDDDHNQLFRFLQDVVTTLAICQAPLDSIQAAFQELSACTSNHEILLGVLWEAVVHKLALVRVAAARLFELLIQGVSETLISTRVVPGLVTLANDPEVSVRIATIPGFGTILENVTLREMLDRVYMQLQTFLDDPVYRDQHTVHMEIIRTFARVGPNAEPRFRDEFVLPRLAAMALANNSITNEIKKTDVALQLFEAYSAMSCCFINDQLVQEAMLPGLRYLRQDLSQLAPEREEVMSSMIKEYEAKLDASKSLERSPSQSVSPTPGGNAEDVRARVMSKIKDTTSKAHIPNIFMRKK
ncbi:RAB11-binding protein RELCH homolog isoform X2 [Octopus bimaculoides]|uniref:RAB11-binding protein RELCH homolog isoform X2 n=1 Tax=Octopus bimaculoides TaxID=37653 RepID=UPI0022E7D31E|nr:RAB11-binding protein RELCH homolog isoform X2 [Octopus bimaculoides]